MGRRREEIKDRHRPLGYIEWLKREAERGSVPAIYSLRKRGAVAPALVNITARDLRNVRLVTGKIVHVTGRGTLFYRTGGDIFRDSGSHLSMKKEVSDQGVKAALMIAMAKFNGQALVFNGSDRLRAKCIEVAAREGLSRPSRGYGKIRRSEVETARAANSQSGNGTRNTGRHTE